MDFEESVKKECQELYNMLCIKNKAYGNSALEPLRIFSRASPEEQILIRIDDKLSRLQRGKPEDNEDTIRDLIGYLILLRISKHNNDNKDTKIPDVVRNEGQEPPEIEANTKAIIPVATVPSFRYPNGNPDQELGKASYGVTKDGRIGIYLKQYQLHVYTTIEEIKRLKALSEEDLKRTLIDYERSTYANKALVLRYFLKELKDVSILQPK